MGITKGGKHNIFWYAFMTLVMFCFIYQFRLSLFGFPDQLHSKRIAALILYSYYFISLFRAQPRTYDNSKEAISFYRRLIVVHILIFFYMLIIYLVIGINEGIHMVTVLPNFFFISLIPIYLCSKLFYNIDEFYIVILTATLFQTVIVWISILFPNVATFLDLYFNDTEYFEMFRGGYAGGLGCITAPGYIRYSLGQIACCYLYISKKEVKYLLIYLVLLLTGSMIARTGLLAGAIGLLFMIFYKVRIREIGSFIPIMFFTIFTIIVADLLLSNNTISEFLGERFYRMTTLIVESQEWGFFNDSFFEGYFNGETTIIPPLSFETIIGTGVPAGIAGNGIEVNVDGGWFRLYAAYGLILAILFYVYLFGSMLYEALRHKDIEIKYILLLTIIFLLIAEFKEWAIYSSPFVLFFTVTLILASRNSCKYQDPKTSV